jgi:hypothetical protein
LLSLALIFAGLFLALQSPAGLVAGLCLFWGLGVLRLLYGSRDEQRKTNRGLGELSEDLLWLAQRDSKSSSGVVPLVQAGSARGVETIREYLEQKKATLDEAGPHHKEGGKEPVLSLPKRKTKGDN